MISPKSALAALSIACLALACAPDRARRGDINLVYGLTGQHRALFEVEEGRILSQSLDLATVAPGEDACVRGTWGQSSLSLCPTPLDPADSHYGGKIVRWKGPMGDLAIEVSPSGEAVRVDGRLSRQSGAGTASADASAHGMGGHGMRGSGRGSGQQPPDVWMHITLPLGSGPEWDEMRKEPILYAVAAASIGLTEGEGVPPRLQPGRVPQRDLPPPPESAPPAQTAPPAPTPSSAPAPSAAN